MKKVLVGGVFNVIHEGHRFFLKKAKELGDFLIVVVASNRTAFLTKKYAIFDQKERVKNLEKLGIADKVTAGDSIDFMKVVWKEKPDIIVLGHDQKMSEKELGKLLLMKGMKCEVVRLEEKLKGYSTSKIMKRKSRSPR